MLTTARYWTLPCHQTEPFGGSHQKVLSIELDQVHDFIFKTTFPLTQDHHERKVIFSSCCCTLVNKFLVDLISLERWDSSLVLWWSCLDSLRLLVL